MSSSRTSSQYSRRSLMWRTSNRCSRTTTISSLFYSFLLLHPLTLLCIRAADVYVDDNDGSISYSPSSSWAQGNGCGSCALSPDSGSAYDGTWHDTTYYPSGSARTITFSFTGTGISAYFIIPDKTQGSASVDTSLTFTLDGSQAGKYTHTQSGSANFLYNQQVFSTSGLSNGEHTLVVSAGATSDGGSTAVLFDYFVYTTQDISSTSTAAPASTSSSAQDSSPSTTQAATASSPNKSGSSSPLNTATSSSSDSSQTGTATGGTSPSGTSLSLGSSGTTSTDSAFGTSQHVSATNAQSSFPSQSGSSDNSTSPLSDSDSESGSTSSNVGAIIGGVAGATLGLITLLVVLLCWKRRRSRQVESVYGSEDPLSPTVVSETNGGWMRKLFCLSDSESSGLTPHPVVFIDRRAPSTPAQGTEKRSFGISRPNHGIGISRTYNVKGRPLIRRDVIETTDNLDVLASPTTSSPGNTQMNNSRVDEETSELGPGTTAILSQVAALQAVVMSLQEQRAREIGRVTNPVDIGVAPPEYSRIPRTRNTWWNVVFTLLHHP